MSAAVADSRVQLADWARALPTGRVAGSIYAVEPDRRVQAAESLCAHGMPIHADLILAPSQSGGDPVHRGVSLAEVRAVRAALPDARIDLHLILLAGVALEPDSAEMRAVLALAEEVGAERIVLPEHLAADPEICAAFGAAGCATWRELPPSRPVDAGEQRPGEQGAGEQRSGAADEGMATLVMLIEPGTRDVADPALVERVGELTARTAVGVDGGVGPELAERALLLGADHVVAGRSLFTAHDPTTRE